MSTYNIKIVDSISDSIPKKLADISQQATKSSTSTAKLQKLLNKSSAHNRFITMQQRVAMSNARVAVSANRTIGSLAKLETAQLRAAMAAQRAASKHSLASRSILIGSARIISAISRWMSLLGLGFSLKFITRFTDEFTNLENKLKNVAASSANLARLNEEVFASANRARVPVQELAQTYQRIDLAVKDLGFSQKEAMRITETASKALALSGATTGETAAALLQLSQAFNKGKLDGDEFRTVMELMPTAADAIAKQLGVTRGELLKLAPEGIITAKVMADAFQNIAKEVDDKFSKITTTIGQALTVLRNNAVRTWGEFDKSVGTTDKLSRAILTLSDNLDVLGKFAAGAGAGLVAYFGVTLVGAVLNGKSAVKGLWALISAHPLGALATAIGLVTMGLVYNSDEIIVNQEKMLTLRDYAVGAWNLIADNAKYAADAVKLTWNQALDLVTKGWNNVSIEVKAALQSILQTAITVSKFIVNKQIATVNTIVSLWETLPAIMDGIWFGVADVAAKYVEQMITDFTGVFKLLDYVDKKMGGSGIDYGIDLGRDSRGTFSGTSREDAKAALTNAIETSLKNFNKDYVGDTAKGIREGLKPLLNTLDEAAQKASDDRATRIILNGMIQKDSYYDQNRPVVPTGGDSAASKAAKGSTKRELTEQEKARKRFLDTAKGMVNRDTNYIADKWGIEVKNACAAVVREVAKEAKVELGVSKRPIDYAITPPDAQGAAYANSLFGKDIARVFTDIKEVKPGDLVAIEDATNKWIRHVGIISSISNGVLKMIDNSSSAGAVKERTVSSVGKVKAFATPNAFLGQKETLKKLADEKEAAERLPKVYEKAKNEITKDTLMIIDSFDYIFDAAEKGAKGWEKYFEQKGEMLKYNQALKDETELVKMASDVAETHAQWLEYKNKFAEQATKLNEKDFKQIIDTNRELERQRQIREGILANSRIGEEKDFQSALKAVGGMAGTTLEGKEREAYASSMLEQFVGVDTSLLTSNLNQSLVAWEDYYRRLQELVQESLVFQKEADEIVFQHKMAVMDSALTATSQMFSDLSSLTKDGSKELITISKAAAIAQTIFSTYSAAQLAFEQGVKMGGMPLGIIQAAAAVAQGLARVAQIRAQGTEGYMTGGYTGNGPRSSVAGVVHGQEFVMNAQATQRIGVGNLQALQDGRSLQSYNPPQQQNKEAQPMVVNSPPVNVTIVSSKEEAYAAMRSNEGKNIFLQVVEDNGRAIAQMIQQ